MNKNNITNKNFIFSTVLVAVTLISQPVIAAKFKCWTNNDGIKECGSYVPAEYSQKRIETRGDNGRLIEIKERAKNKAEIAEIERLKKLQAIEDKKISKQKKKDDILLKTFSTERDINMLRDSKINVINGIITVTKGNNKALTKKLEKLQKKAANIERRGKKPSKIVLEDIATIENRLKKNTNAIKSKKAEQDVIYKKFAKDLARFQRLKKR